MRQGKPVLSLKLRRYCQRIGGDPPMVAEFGWDWEERLARVQKEAEALLGKPNRKQRERS